MLHVYPRETPGVRGRSGQPIVLHQTRTDARSFGCALCLVLVRWRCCKYTRFRAQARNSHLHNHGFRWSLLIAFCYVWDRVAHCTVHIYYIGSASLARQSPSFSSSAVQFARPRYLYSGIFLTDQAVSSVLNQPRIAVSRCCPQSVPTSLSSSPTTSDSATLHHSAQRSLRLTCPSLPLMVSASPTFMQQQHALPHEP